MLIPADNGIEADLMSTEVGLRQMPQPDEQNAVGQCEQVQKIDFGQMPKVKQNVYKPKLWFEYLEKPPLGGISHGFITRQVSNSRSVPALLPANDTHCVRHCLRTTRYSISPVMNATSLPGHCVCVCEGVVWEARGDLSEYLGLRKQKW